jgi:hypothetical protein
MNRFAEIEVAVVQRSGTYAKLRPDFCFVGGMIGPMFGADSDRRHILKKIEVTPFVPETPRHFDRRGQ